MPAILCFPACCCRCCCSAPLIQFRIHPFHPLSLSLSKPHLTTGERLTSEQLADACISSLSANPAAATAAGGPPGGVVEGRGGGGEKCASAAAAAEEDGVRGSGGKAQTPSSPPPPSRPRLEDGQRRGETTPPRIPDSVIAKVCRPRFQAFSLTSAGTFPPEFRSFVSRLFFHPKSDERTLPDEEE